MYKDYPLEFHANARKAAEASRCAAEQGKYWEYHDVLFANGTALELANLKKYATDLKLDVTQFTTCLDSGKHAAAITKAALDGSCELSRATLEMFCDILGSVAGNLAAD